MNVELLLIFVLVMSVVHVSTTTTIAKNSN